MATADRRQHKRRASDKFHTWQRRTVESTIELHGTKEAVEWLDRKMILLQRLEDAAMEVK